MPRFTCGSVQTRRWLGFEDGSALTSQLTAPVTVASPAMDVYTCRSARWSCRPAGVVASHGYPLIRYIPVARVDRDDTVHNDEWAEHGTRCALRSERLR